MQCRGADKRCEGCAPARAGPSGGEQPLLGGLGLLDVLQLEVHGQLHLLDARHPRRHVLLLRLLALQGPPRSNQCQRVLFGRTPSAAPPPEAVLEHKCNKICLGLKKNRSKGLHASTMPGTAALSSTCCTGCAPSGCRVCCTGRPPLLEGHPPRPRPRSSAASPAAWPAATRCTSPCACAAANPFAAHARRMHDPILSTSGGSAKSAHLRVHLKVVARLLLHVGSHELVLGALRRCGLPTHNHAHQHEVTQRHWGVRVRSGLLPVNTC